MRLPAEEPADFVPRTAKVALAAKVAAVAGLLVAVVLGVVAGDGFRQFYFAYLTGFAFFLAIALCALFFVLIHHVTRAGWSVNVRRVAENMAATLPVLGVLSLPIFVSVMLQEGDLYRWALKATDEHVSPEAKVDAGKPHEAARTGEEAAAKSTGSEHADVQHAGGGTASHEADPGRGNRTLDELTLKKRAWLNPLFFCARLAIYFVLWSVIALYYLRKSSQQDVDGDYRHTSDMQRYSGISLVIFGLTITLAAWDLFMSLDPHWYSTMFGVYYFASGTVMFFAATIIVCALLQRAGFLREAINTEHYHDLGKYLFAFTFFWGYITFSQYMLIWYASIPEEVGWPARRGMSTSDRFEPNVLGNEWRWWAIMILFGCLLIPFGGLLSRHVKRNLKALVFWAVWLLVFQFCNMIWIVLPELRVGLEHAVMPIVGALASWLGIGGVVVAAWLRSASKHKLRPMNDPRMFESAAFVNI